MRTRTSPKTPPRPPRGLSRGQTVKGMQIIEPHLRDWSPLRRQGGEASILPEDDSESDARGLTPQNLDARLKTTEQKITLTRSELDAHVAARVAVARAARSPYTSGKLSGVEGAQVTAPPLAPDFMYDTLSEVPSDRRKTKHMRQATPLSKKKSAEAAAAFRGEDEAAAAWRRPSPRSKKKGAGSAAEDASDALFGVPSDRRTTRHTDQATLPSKKGEAEPPAAFLGEERAFAAERGPEAPQPAPDRISAALSALPGRKVPMRQATTPERGSTPLSRKPGADLAAVFLREGEAAEAEEFAGNVATGAHEREAGVESWEAPAPGVEETVAGLREKLRAATSGQDSALLREELALEREQNRLDAEYKALRARRAVLLQGRTEHPPEHKTAGQRPTEETPMHGGLQGRRQGLRSETVDGRWTEGMPPAGVWGALGALPDQGDFGGSRAIAAAQERAADAQELMAHSQRVKSGETGDPRGHKYNTSNPKFLQNRLMLSGGGFRESGFLPDAFHGSSYEALLFIKFRKPGVLYREHGFCFELLPSMYLAAVRGLLEPLALGAFRDVNRTHLPLRAPKTTVPLKVETGIKPPEGIYEIERCCKNFVSFVRVAFNPHLGNACTKFFDALFEEFRCGDNVLEEEDLLAAADDVKRQVDTNTYESQAKVESFVSLDPTAGAIHGISRAALQARATVGLTRDREGRTIMTPPEYGLDPSDKNGLFQDLLRAKKAVLDARSKALLKEDIKRRPFDNEGGSRTTTSTATTTTTTEHSPVKHVEREGAAAVKPWVEPVKKESAPVEKSEQPSQGSGWQGPPEARAKGPQEERRSTSDTWGRQRAYRKARRSRNRRGKARSSDGAAASTSGATPSATTSGHDAAESSDGATATGGTPGGGSRSYSIIAYALCASSMAFGFQKLIAGAGLSLHADS